MLVSSLLKHCDHTEPVTRVGTQTQVLLTLETTRFQMARKSTLEASKLHSLNRLGEELSPNMLCKSCDQGPWDLFYPTCLAKGRLRTWVIHLLRRQAWQYTYAGGWRQKDPEFQPS